MNLENYKINGYASSVTALPDYPSDAGITAQQLKAVFDARSDGEIKNQHNALVDFIGARLDEIFAGIANKVDIIPGKGLSTNDFDEDYRIMVLNADMAAAVAGNDLMAHIEDLGNPHNVTAAQVGAYTKAEVETKLGDYITILDLDNALGQFNEYYDKYEIDLMIGDIASALDELHEYAVSLAGGEG